MREALRGHRLRDGDELVLAEEAGAERDVEGNLLARTAEQRSDGDAERLAFQVPERDVDAGDRVSGKAGLAPRREAPVELAPDGLVIHRVFADDRGRDELIGETRYRLGIGDRRDAVADEPVRGLHFEI